MSTHAQRLEWAKGARQRYAGRPTLAEGMTEAEYVAVLVGCCRADAEKLLGELDAPCAAKRPRRAPKRGTRG